MAVIPGLTLTSSHQRNLPVQVCYRIGMLAMFRGHRLNLNLNRRSNLERKTSMLS